MPHMDDMKVAPASSDTSGIFDTRGNPILKGSIVGMGEVGHWSFAQGLVVEPRSDIEAKEYCVAVFFNVEVGSSHFFIYISADQQREIIPIDIWDRTHANGCRKGETDFLFAEEVWKKCPRVIFFRPDELVVQTDWKVEVLAQRTFGKNFHSICSINEKLPQTPSAYMCWLEECEAPATKMAVYNVWGSVYSICTCDRCFSKTNGVRADNLPPMKKQKYAPDGVVIPLS